MKKIIIYLTCIIILGSCSTKIPLKPTFYQSKTRTGLLVITNASAVEYGGNSYGGGLIGAAISSSLVPKQSKYDTVLSLIGPSLDPKIKLEQLYMDMFSKKGKELILLNENFDIKDFKKYETTDTSKKFFEKDLRSLKAQYGVDELFLVRVGYGMTIKYSYAIETGKSAVMVAIPMIINLSDNSIMYRDKSSASQSIKGKWNTPPDYTLIRTAISNAIGLAIEQEKLKYK